MIQILPVPPEGLSDFCREHSLEGQALRAYTAQDEENALGWCAIGEGDPCPILGAKAEDPDVADGLLRAALFPLFRRGCREYRFAAPVNCPLPKRYVTDGTGTLAELFAPCTNREEAKNE